jgi:hypothetical protein
MVRAFVSRRVATAHRGSISSLAQRVFGPP